MSCFSKPKKKKKERYDNELKSLILFYAVRSENAIKEFYSLKLSQRKKKS